MTYYIDAIYDNGVLNPLQPLSLPDQSRVRLQIDVEQPSAVQADNEAIADEVKRQREAARRLDEKLAGLADLSPDDGFTCRDHDRILYGESR